MRILLFTAASCLAFLTLSGVMPAPARYGLLLADLTWILYLERQRYKKAEQLRTRRSLHKARWAIYVRHLSGLPLPTDTPAVLLASEQGFILETEQKSWTVSLADMHKLLLATGEQLRKKNDQQLCQQLDIADCVFFALRDRMRREKKSNRRGFIFLATQEKSPWVLITGGRWQNLANLLRAGEQNEQIIYLLDEGK